MIILTSLFLPLAIIYLGLGKPMEIINLRFITGVCRKSDKE